jgi:hypothetical protein
MMLRTYTREFGAVPRITGIASSQLKAYAR